MKNDILSKYTTSERLSITTSFLTSQGAESVRSKLKGSYTLFVLLFHLSVGGTLQCQYLLVIVTCSIHLFPVNFFGCLCR